MCDCSRESGSTKHVCRLESALGIGLGSKTAVVCFFVLGYKGDKMLSSASLISVCHLAPVWTMVSQVQRKGSIFKKSLLWHVQCVHTKHLQPCFEKTSSCPACCYCCLALLQVWAAAH
jgi:hypothetical protein